MLPINISTADIETIKVQKKMHTCSSVRTRCLILWMRYCGFPPCQTARAADCHVNTVTNVVSMYNQSGIGRILRVPSGTKRHALADRIEQVREQLQGVQIQTLQQARALLADQFGYRVSLESVRRVLKRLGWRRLKVNPFPGNAKKLRDWLVQQKAWIAHLKELHRQAKVGRLDMAFCDAAHFVYGKFGAYRWTDQVSYQPTGSGRHRLNVYGAYDPISKRILTNYGEGRVDANYVVHFLHWLRQHHYPDRSRALHLMMDNARYQHCQYVKQEAQKLNIRLEFQPSYSPNLNLIERFWKYAKKIIGKNYYQTKEAFFQAIVKLLETTDEPVHQTKFETLLTMKFQTYEKSQILC